MSPGIILFLALFHLAIDWIGMIKYYFHPTKVNISRLRTLSRSRSQMELLSWQIIQVHFHDYSNIKILGTSQISDLKQNWPFGSDLRFRGPFTLILKYLPTLPQKMTDLLQFECSLFCKIVAKIKLPQTNQHTRIHLTKQFRIAI